MQPNNVDLTKLTSETITKVLRIVGQGQFTVAGANLALVTQELATLESLQRKLEAGELVVVSPPQEITDDDNTDGE